MLAGAAGVIAVVLVVLFLSAIVSAIRGRRAAAVRQEPVFGRARNDTARLEASLPDRGKGPTGASLPLLEPRRRFSWGVLVLAFVVGFGGGAAGYFLSAAGEFGSLARTVSSLVGAGSSSAEASGLAILSESAGAAPSGDAAALPAEVEKRLSEFAGKLRERLPRDAGPEIALTTVEIRGMTLSLGYSVGRALEDSEVPDFDGYIMRTVKSLFCGKDAKELRFLNDNGVSFHMTYDDLGGDVVARLTVPPNFCA
ncbi:MAG TPA: hypothetical protein PKA74_01080 [Bauldia sp.]|nr:hypothetical protein [Bauldia sp.]